MKLETLNRVCSNVAGISLLNTLVLLAVALCSGTPAQKDVFARLAAGTGVLFALSATIAITSTDYLMGAEDSPNE